MLQGMFDRRTMWREELKLEWKFLWTDYGSKDFKATVPNADKDRSKTTGGCGIFQLFG